MDRKYNIIADNAAEAYARRICGQFTEEKLVAASNKGTYKRALKDIEACETRLEVTEEYPLNKLIVYLDYFDEYTDYEQKMLNKLVEAYKADEKFWGVVESVFMIPENIFKRK